MNKYIYLILTITSFFCACAQNGFIYFNSNQPEPLLMEMAVSTPATCGNANASITAGSVSGGSVPYEYSMNGGSFSNGNYFSGLPAYNHLLTIKDNNECTLTTNIDLSICHEIIIPEGISPNGDGENDTWKITGLNDLKNIQIKVTNTLGQLIHFQKGNYIPWDGRYNEETVKKGYYFFEVSAESTPPFFKSGVLFVSY
jgi:gliding motility-associated-like protein